MNKKQEDGFYWVLINRGNEHVWTVCEYARGIWNHKGCAYNDENFIEIDERKIIRK